MANKLKQKKVAVLRAQMPHTDYTFTGKTTVEGHADERSSMLGHGHGHSHLPTDLGEQDSLKVIIRS